MSKQELYRIIASARAAGLERTVTVRTRKFVYTDVGPLSKSGERFMGFDSVTRMPHRFHISAVVSAEIV